MNKIVKLTIIAIVISVSISMLSTSLFSDGHNAPADTSKKVEKIGSPKGSTTAKTPLYSLVQSKITIDDIQAFKAQAKKMKDATENEIGTISYDFFINEEKREVFIVEKYADDKAFMVHMEKFLQEEFIPKILTMMELTSLKMLGPVTEEIDDFFAKGGWTYDAYPLAM